MSALRFKKFFKPNIESMCCTKCKANKYNAVHSLTLWFVNTSLILYHSMPTCLLDCQSFKFSFSILLSFSSNFPILLTHSLTQFPFLSNLVVSIHLCLSIVSSPPLTRITSSFTHLLLSIGLGVSCSLPILKRTRAQQQHLSMVHPNPVNVLVTLYLGLFFFCNVNFHSSSFSSDRNVFPIIKNK